MSNWRYTWKGSTRPSSDSERMTAEEARLELAKAYESKDPVRIFIARGELQQAERIRTR